MSAGRFPSAAAGVLLLILLTVFYPTLFLGHVISPLDTLFQVPPWDSIHRTVEATNATLEPAAARTLPAVLQLRRAGPATAVWDPARAGGGPGLLRWDLGLLWPFGLPGHLLLEEAFLVNGMVLARLAAAFVGCVLLLRRTGVSELAAAAGGAAYALSGPLVTRWAEPAGAALATLPLLLAAADSAGKASAPWRRLPTLTLAWLAFLAAGDSAVVPIGGAAVLAVALATAHPPRLRRLGPQLVSPALAAAVLAPALFLSTVAPSQPAPEPVRGLGLDTIRLLVDPFAWGSPRADTYQPPPGLEDLPFQDACLAVGWVVLALAAVGAAGGGRRALRWLAAAAAVLVAVAFAPVGRVLATLPGVDSGELPQIAGLAALAISGLAAIGLDRLLGLRRSPRWRIAGALLAAAVVLQGGLLAGHLWAHLPVAQARLEVTPALADLSSRLDPLEPWRMVAFLDALPPDTAAAFGLEDLRSGRATSARYRRLLAAVDPQSTQSGSLRLNPATADLQHPLVDLLGTRFLLEPPRLRLVEFALGQDTLEIEPRDRLAGPVDPRGLVQELVLPPGCSRIALHATARGNAVAGTVEVRLEPVGPGREPTTWTLDAGRLGREGMAWLHLPSSDRQHTPARLLVRAATGGELWLRATSDARALEGGLRHGDRALGVDLALSFDTSGFSVLRDGGDLRVWVNHHALPRAFLVRRVVPGDLATLIEADPPIDTAVAVVLPPGVASELPPMPEREPASSEGVVVVAARPSRLVVEVDLLDPAVLATGIPANPLWSGRVDGEPHPLVEANGLFLALVLGPGPHRVELEASVPTLWYVCSGAGLAGLLAAAALGRRRPTT